MSSLKDKLLKIKEILEKGMKNGGIGGPGSVKSGASLPSLPKVGSTNNNSATASVGVAPKSKKNPIKSAEQTQNKDIKDIKMKEAQAAMSTQAIKSEMIKFDEHGQWSLEKMKDRETAVPGVSEMGIEARRATGKPSSETGYFAPSSPEVHRESARQIARQNLKDTKNIKPKLPKDNLTKSGYDGYTDSDNARRKANNMTESTGIHTMNRVKRYGGSGVDAANKQAQSAKLKSAKNHTHIKNGEGKVVDVVHSSGKKKGKSIFSDEKQKAIHLSDLNKV